MTAAHMEHAFSLAWQGAGAVSPRPPVGAVVVSNDGEIVGQGCTEPRPGRHAEVVALEQAGQRANGATLYCTLEPHSFAGAAPPCTRAIIQAGVSRVVVAILDPNPKVNGSGLREMRAASIGVELSEDPTAIERANELVEGFAKHIQSGLPFVMAKFAMSLDGRIATRSGDSQWITGEDARQHAHSLRRRADALVTGIGTVLSDDPRLTERDEEGQPTGRPRLRVIVDTHARMPANARLLQEPGQVLWAIGDNATPSFERPDLEVLQLPRTDGRIDLHALMGELGHRGCCTVMAEAGSELLGSLFDARQVDRVDAYISPAVIGGTDALGPVGGMGATSLSDALRLQRVRYTRVGGDMLVTGYVNSDKE